MEVHDRYRAQATANPMWWLISILLLDTSAASIPASDAVAPPGNVNFQLLAALVVCVILLTALSWSNARRELKSYRLKKALLAGLGDPQLILEKLPDPVWLKDPDGVYLNANPALAGLIGRPLTEIIGHTDFDLMELSQARRAKRGDQAAIEGGRTRSAQDWVIFASDRRAAYLQIIRRPLYGDDGRLIGLLGTARDITELNRAQNTVREQESYQRALLDSLPFAVWLKDPDGRYLAANKAYADLAQIDHPAKLKSRDDASLWPPDIARREQLEDREVMRLREKREQTTPMTWRDREHWYETIKAPVIDDHNEVLGTVGFARDITQSHQMRQALSESEQQFRRFFEDNASVMLLIAPDSGRIRNANKAAARFYGYTVERLTQLRIDDINTMSAQALSDARQLAAHREQGHFEFIHRLADGRERNVEVYSTPVEAGGMSLLFSVVYDVTERKQLHEQLRLSASVFEAASEAILITNASGIIVDTNPMFTKLTGYSRSEAIGQRPAMLQSGQQDDAFYTEMWRSLGEVGRWQGRIVNKKKNGELYQERLSISAVRDDEGRTTHYVGLFHQIGEVRERTLTEG